MQRVAFDVMVEQFRRALAAAGMPGDRAEVVARVFAENSRDGIYSHGLNRFPDFLESVRSRAIDPGGTPEKVGEFGVIEQWDGHRGPGILNAIHCMGRAVEIARRHTLGCVALRNTTHWLRAGHYGLQAAEAGCIGVCWTNGQAMMPPWGSAEPKLGNNPLVVCIPRTAGPILLDMALTQFSGGRLDIHRRAGRPLPVPGGYDAAGELTTDAAAIRQSRRHLPIGYWKGAGLAMVLDALAALLSAGRATWQLEQGAVERDISQVFIAIDIAAIRDRQSVDETLDAVVANLTSAAPLGAGSPVTYPGQRMIETRRENLEHGIPVDAEYWAQVVASCPS